MKRLACLALLFVALSAACAGQHAAADVVPQSAIQSLVIGQAPVGLVRLGTGQCQPAILQSAGLYAVTCGQYVFLVNTASSSVTPADATTRRVWDFRLSQQAH